MTPVGNVSGFEMGFDYDAFSRSNQIARADAKSAALRGWHP